MRKRRALALGLLLLACGRSTAARGGLIGGDESESGGESESGPSDDLPSEDDLPSREDLPPERPVCTAAPDGVVERCPAGDPAATFDPVIEWAWMGDGDQVQVTTTPLVANLTDDDGNDTIDLCDVPDVVVPVFADYEAWVGNLYALDGASGVMHWRSETEVAADVTPALGDIDGDLLPEIVTLTHDPDGNPRRLVVFEHDGSESAVGEPYFSDTSVGAIALADLDNDGSVEVIANNMIFGADLSLEAVMPAIVINWSSPTAADLDDDSDLEVVLGSSAWHEDGEELWSYAPAGTGWPHVADLDDDGDPEVLLAGTSGLSLFEHDGTPVYVQDWPAFGPHWAPGVVGDFDGDGAADIAASHGMDLLVFTADLDLIASFEVDDFTGAAGPTAFDFLGDGTPEVVFADEHDIFVLEESVATSLGPRSGGTLIESPVVADVDNDGSAEFIVVSNEGWIGRQTAPAVRVFGDARSTWVGARRIWNQHAYHVTNVREDGTIPQFEEPAWATFDTFRANARLENGIPCLPGR